MPLNVSEDLPTKFPNPDYLTLDNFKRGVITLVDPSNLPRNALSKADNTYLVEDGQPASRPGLGWFGSALPEAALSTPQKLPTTANKTNDWNTIENVYAEDGAYAYSGGYFASTLRVNGFGFAVPSQSTITGIEVSVKGYATTVGKDQLKVAITKDGAIGIGNTTTVTLPSSNADVTVSSSTSLFGLSFTPEEVNAPSFGISLGQILNGGPFYIDVVRVKVYYTFNGGIDGFDYFDTNGSLHLVAAHGGTIYRSTNHGVTWTACTGGSVTPGVTCNFNQNGAFLYVTTGVDAMLRYDGTTTLQSYTPLTTPTAPTIAKTGLGGTTYTYYYKISAVNKVGFSIASAAASIQTDRPRSSWDKTSNFVTLTLPAPQSTQERADIYFSDDNLNFYYLDSIVSSASNPSVTYRDDGTAIVVPSTLAPTANTTDGPRYSVLRNVGTRMFGVRDPLNRARIGFTGTGNFSGAFSSAYDGGYLDWQPGGKEYPVDVEDYRDGKGSPLATIWCDSGDGQGSVIQMSLDTITIQDISITVPSAFRLPGSRGTPAPGSVVNVLNDYMYYNSQAIYNLGNARNMPVPILSTDEVSANIRPTIRQVNTSAESKIVATYYDAKVLFSVPDGASENNVTHMYDTERKSWIPRAFTVGFKRFLKYTYTDASGNKSRKLLAIKPGDRQLTEISNTFYGDYGKPYVMDIVTGLIPTTKNRFDFQFVEEAEFEVSKAEGQINFEVSGIERARGYSTIKRVTLNLSQKLTTVGWDTKQWDKSPWDNTSNTVTPTYTESSTKRYTGLQREMNAVQWRIYTNTVESKAIIRTLQTWGTPTWGGHPSPWRIR